MYKVYKFNNQYFCVTSDNILSHRYSDEYELIVDLYKGRAEFSKWNGFIPEGSEIVFTYSDSEKLKKLRPEAFI